MNIKDKKILILSMLSSAIISSLITYYATKTNYQEQYYSQMLEDKTQNKIKQDKLNQNFKFTIGDEKAY